MPETASADSDLGFDADAMRERTITPDTATLLSKLGFWGWASNSLVGGWWGVVRSRSIGVSGSVTCYSRAVRVLGIAPLTDVRGTDSE